GDHSRRKPRLQHRDAGPLQPRGARLPGDRTGLARMRPASLSWAETFGVTPLSTRLGEAMTTFRGAEGVPPSRFDRTSLGIFQPRLAFATWLGRRRRDRR